MYKLILIKEWVILFYAERKRELEYVENFNILQLTENSW